MNTRITLLSVTFSFICTIHGSYMTGQVTVQ